MTLETPPPPSTPSQSCCKEFAQRISDFHDGRWPPESSDCTAVEEHLATCPRCAELLDDYRLISEAAKGLRAAQVPEDCAETMRRRVRARIRGQVFRRRLAWTGAGVAAAAAASVALAFAIAPVAQPPPQATAGGGAKDEAPEPVDLLKNPAVAALLRALEAEALLDEEGAPSDGRLTTQEEIDLRRDWGVHWARDLDGQRWGVSRVPGAEFPMTGDDLDMFRPWDPPRRRPPGGPDVVPVGNDGP